VQIPPRDTSKLPATFEGAAKTQASNPNWGKAAYKPANPRDFTGIWPVLVTMVDVEKPAGMPNSLRDDFVAGMTAHHKGGIHMAEGCVAKCTVGVEKRLAQGMVDAQQSEIALMADMLKARGA